VGAWAQADTSRGSVPLIARIQVGTMSVSGYTDPSFTLEGGLGLQASRHWAFVLGAFHQTAHVLPPYDSLGVFSRVGVTAAAEWSRMPLDPRDLVGDVAGSARLVAGALFREDLAAAALGGLGAIVRLGLSQQVGAFAALHGWLIVAPDDPLPRCTTPGGVVGGEPVCHPFAVDDSPQASWGLAVGVELRL
jgi:hypothetical protein